MPARILLVEDDPGIGASLAEALTGQGHQVVWRRTAAEAFDAAHDCDIVLLDLGLPDAEGTDVCRRLRSEHPATAIVVVTARDAEVDIVLGLDAGADDYLVKPFRLAELLARIRAQERRLEQVGSGGVARAGAVELDHAARRAFVGDRELVLTRKEFDLLALLVARSGQAVLREHIIDAVWDEHWHRSTKTLDMHIVALRRKLAEPGGGSVRITTLRGVGYRLDVA